MKNIIVNKYLDDIPYMANWRYKNISLRVAHLVSFHEPNELILLDTMYTPTSSLLIIKNQIFG